MCAFAVITEDLKTNNVWDNVGGLDAAAAASRKVVFRFEVQVFVLERLRLAQNHTMELCEVTNGSPEIVGIV